MISYYINKSIKEGKLKELKDHIDEIYDNDCAFINSCKKGHKEIAEWLYSLGGVDIHAHNDSAFRWSCYYGHKEIAEWLYSLGGVNIHAENEFAFRWSCIEGHIEIAKWLYSLGGVDIHADNDCAFRKSCKNGHKEITDWLYDIDGKIDPNIIKKYRKRIKKWKLGEKIKTTQDGDVTNVHKNDHTLFILSV